MKQQELKPVLKNIDELMTLNGVSLLIHHFNKATGEMGMEIDRQGSIYVLAHDNFI